MKNQNSTKFRGSNPEQRPIGDEQHNN